MTSLANLKLVVDQNCFRSPDTRLRTHLAASTENLAVLTDTAVFEMLKGSDPIYAARRSFEILMDYPDQVVVTDGTGELIRREIAEQLPITSPEDLDLTTRTRTLLREIKKFTLNQRSDFPLDAAKIQNEIGLAIAQRIDGPFHKASLVGGVDVLRKQLPANIRSDAKNGNMTQALYGFIYQSGYLAFSNAMSAHGVPTNKIEELYLGYSLGARLTILYQLSVVSWFKTNGAESLHESGATNDLLDVDYVTTATYFDGIISKEPRVNALYSCAKDFFEFRPKGLIP